LVCAVWLDDVLTNVTRTAIPPEPPRLLYFVNDAGFFVSHRLALAIAAKTAGYDVHVATGPGPAVSNVRAAGLEHHTVPLSRSGVHPLAELRLLTSIYHLFRAVRPDLVHLVTIKPVIYGGVLARITRVPRVVAAISGLGFVFLSSGPGARLRRLIVVRLYRIALRHPRLTMIFQNPQDRAEMLQQTGLTDADAVIVAGSGVDLSRFHTPHRAPSRPVVVMAARLLLDKGVREYVAAATHIRHSHPHVRFLLAGNEDPGNPTSITAAQLRVWHSEGNVELLGQCDDIPALFRQADIVVLPSYREGLPKVLAEAAAAQCAVVTTDVPGCRDAIIPGVTGLLVAPGDTDSLVTALEHLLSDADLRARMGAAGRDLAVRRFSLPSIVAQQLDVYEALFQPR
jgi:glycosyltransferase involved in cell wall biosynthesis